MGKKEFNQTELLKHLVDNKPICASCRKNAFEVKLTLHHKDHNKENDNYTNIAILCENCHINLEGKDKKKRDLR